jgi:hypothetical protein
VNIGGGKIGNCIQLTRTSSTAQSVQQTVTLEIGKIYKASCYIKSGTSGNETCVLLAQQGGTEYAIQGISSGSWVLYTVTFEATHTSVTFIMRKWSATAGTMLFDEATLYEIRPCSTAADTKAADLHSKTSSLDVYQMKDDSTYLEKSYYGLQLVKTAAGAEYYNLNTITHSELLDKRKGKKVTIGCYVYDASGDDDNIKLQIYDGVATAETAFFTSGSKQWLEVTITVDDSATEFTPRILCDGDVGDIAYISPIMVVLGDYIGEGNYAPKQQEIIWTKKDIASNKLDTLASQGDSGWTDLNIEADSDGKLPKGCKAIYMRTNAKDSGSAGSSSILGFRANSIKSYEYIHDLGGIANDEWRYTHGWQSCDENGDVEYNIAASGGATFDLGNIEYHGVQLN